MHSPMRSPRFQTLALIDSLQDVLDSGRDADVIFLVGKEKIPAHKFMLCIRSSIMKEYFRFCHKGHRCAVFTMKDISPKDFKEFLNFLYTGECCLTKENVEPMLDLGNKYEVSCLKEKCLHFMEDHIEDSTVLQYAKIGLKYFDDTYLFNECLKALPEFLVDINFMTKEKGEWVPLPYELLLHIVQHCERDPQLEETLLYKLIDWAKKECQYHKLHITPKSLQAVLCDIPSYLHFDRLSSRALVTIVRENKILPAEELLDIFCARAMCEV